MGPTMARLAKRAAPDKRVIGVARFSEKGLKEGLERHGIETIAADLMDRAAVDALPRAKNVVFMAGRKFGASRSEEHTSELQSLMRISHAVFCLKKKKTSHAKAIYTALKISLINSVNYCHTRTTLFSW